MRSNKSNAKVMYSQNNSMIAAAHPARDTSLRRSQTMSDLSVSSSVKSVNNSQEFPVDAPKKNTSGNKEILNICVQSQQGAS